MNKEQKRERGSDPDGGTERGREGIGGKERERERVGGGWRRKDSQIAKQTKNRHTNRRQTPLINPVLRL